MTHDSILIVDDETEVLDYLESSLLCHGYAVHSARDGGEALEILRDENGSVALVVLDLMMPRKDGIETLTEIRKSSKELPVVALSGTSDPNRIVKAMNAGATDFLQKPVAHQRLIETVKRNVGNCRRSGNSAENGGGELYHSYHMRSLAASLDQLAPWDVPVIFRGESGVGKEILVRDLHRRSPRSSKSFVKINCVALPAELLESELFGYEKGAFTGAFQAQAGKFEIANRGTIFLDEIGDMDLKLQAKLLQVLQDGEFYRLGGKEPVKVDVRVVAATHRDLEAAVSEGTFREDLYHRLNVVTIRIPPLRERPEEIVPLAEHFLAKHSKRDVSVPEIPLRLREALVAYQWSGNVRELENLMRKFLVFQDPDQIQTELRRRALRSKGNPSGHVSGPGSIRVPSEGRNGGSSYAGNEPSWNNGQRAASDAPSAIDSPSETDNGCYADPSRPQNPHAAGGGSKGVANGGHEGTPVAESPSPSHPATSSNSQPAVQEKGKASPEDAEGAPAVVDMEKRGASEPNSDNDLLTLSEIDEAQRNIEKRAIMKALDRTNWNRKKAARLLGIDYKALLYKMKKLSI